MYIEVIIVGIIILFVFIYRQNTGNNSYKFIARTVGNTYEKFSPYSFRVVREKAKELVSGVNKNIDLYGYKELEDLKEYIRNEK